MRRIAVALALTALPFAAQEREPLKAGPDVELTVYLLPMVQGAEADAGFEAVPKELKEMVAGLEANAKSLKRSLRLAETFRMRASTVVDSANPSGRAYLLRGPSIARTPPDAPQPAAWPTVDSLRVASIEFAAGGTIRLNGFEIAFRGVASTLGGSAELKSGRPQTIGMVGREPTPAVVVLAARAER